MSTEPLDGLQGGVRNLTGSCVSGWLVTFSYVCLTILNISDRK